MSEAKEVKHYQVSGLDYTMPKLLTAIGIIMVGYFAMTISLAAVPRIVPLKLKELGISSTMMVFIMSTLGQILNMTVCPWVSFKSDRYRSKRWGRRVPFILYTLPLLCLSWIMIGCYETEASWLGRLLDSMIKLSPHMLAIIVLAIGVVIFNFFYMFVGSVFYYIYYDVIPPQFLTRLTGALQITASLSSALFNFYVFEHALTHFKAIFIGISIFYALFMGFMCFALKEPRFPEPDETEMKKGKGLEGFLSFIQESFSHKIYWYKYLQSSCTGIAGAAGIFVVFHTQSMGMTLADIGKQSGIAGICATIATFVVASIGSSYVDKWHPVRISIFLFPFVALTYAYSCKWFFFTPPVKVYWWVTLLLPQVLFLGLFTGISGMPFLMKILPKSRFGQFCSANSLLSCLISMLMALVLGVFIDFLKDTLHLGDHAYRAIYFWYFFFYALGFLFYMLMFREYKKLGGYDGYKAPATWEKSGFETMDISKAEPSNHTCLRYMLYGFDATFLVSALSMLGLAFYAKNIGALAEVQMFLSAAFPTSILILAFWLCLHNRISARIKRLLKGETVSIPHHGVVFLILLMRICCLPIFILQAWMTLAPGETQIAALMTTFDIAIDGILISLLYLYTKMEISQPLEVMSEKQKVSSELKV